MLLGDTKQFCCGFGWRYFHQRNLAKQSILCLKFKSLNFNLFIELLLYKITLQTCRNIFGRAMLHTYIIYYTFLILSTAVCIYTFLFVLLRSFASRNNSGCASLIWLDINTLSVAVTDRPARNRYIDQSPVWANHVENRLVPVPGQSISASLIVYICWHWIFILL